MTLVAITSSRRPENVEVMNASLMGWNPVWYVPADEADAYKAQGANVRPVDGERPMKSIQCNAALDDGFAKGEAVVTLDDDYYSSKRVVITPEGKKRAVRISLNTAITELLDSLWEFPQYHEAGASASLNPFFSNMGYRHHGNVNGQIIAQSPSVVRYDPDLKSKVDFEYCLAHHAEFGGVIIHSELLLDFHMFGRSAALDKKYAGGLAGLRTNDTNAYSISVVKKRYGIGLEDEKIGESRKIKVPWKTIKWVGTPSWQMN
jgi:hypothetical protein